jgi:hypothetical protein
MKTLNLKSLLVTLVVMFFTTQAFAQTMVSTRIDVMGSRYSDQMWVFAVGSCTRGFDNGWDAYKMAGTSTLIPQIYAMESAGNFQIDAVPDMNNTYIGFQAGEDTTYTFTFNNEYIETLYAHLYLVDSVANKTVEVTATGTKYTFNVSTKAAVKRFKLVTSLPTPPVVTDPVVTPPPVVEPAPAPAPAPTPVVVAPTLVITYASKVVTINNPVNEKGTMQLYNSKTGKLVQTSSFAAKCKTTIKINVPAGTYLINASTATLKASLKIII